MTSKREYKVVAIHVSGAAHIDYYDDILEAFNRYYNVNTARAWYAVIYEKVRGGWFEICSGV